MGEGRQRRPWDNSRAARGHSRRVPRERDGQARRAPSTRRDAGLHRDRRRLRARHSRRQSDRQRSSTR
ncbi:hypothetical protein ACFPRL_34545 [Pseudoclavibacter helvolus]